MTSRIPEPMSNEDLAAYRWSTPLPTKPAPSLIGRKHKQQIKMGLVSKHVFAKPPPGSKLPAIAQTVWGYGFDDPTISYPGPTIAVIADPKPQIGCPIQIEWENTLPLKPELPFVKVPPELLAGGSTMTRYSEGHLTAHLHGAHVSAASDGYPVRFKASQAKKANEPILEPGGSTRLCHYPNTQYPGATLWYHDHTMDSTGRNVYATGGILTWSCQFEEALHVALPAECTRRIGNR